MQFTPKKSERQNAAIRLFLQKRYMRSGITQAQMILLKKLTVLSVLNSHAEKKATDMLYLCHAVLESAALLLIPKGYNLRFSIYGSGIKNIDRKIFKSLLLEIICISSTENSELKLIITKRGIKIMYNSSQENSAVKKLSEKLEAVSLKINSSKAHGIYIPTENITISPSVQEKVSEYLTDTFSLVKIFISSVSDKAL